ncbi:hypothetical protein Pst134EB_025001 [Puccinia striiformis f. sp. tritici]|nr:hypothetical protein Pst134EB_025001 [Puccinia striiformis f. sp. tritici]
MRTILEDSGIGLRYWCNIAKVSSLTLNQIPAHKLMPKGEQGTLIGYNDGIQSWKILNKQGKIIDTKHVRFLDYTPTSKISEDDEYFETIEVEDQLEGHFNPQITNPEVAPNDTKDEPTPSGTEIKIEDEDNHEIHSDSSSSNDSDIDVLKSLIPAAACTRVLRDHTSKV